MDGILARDLQLRPSSKFAYLLRPLPTRAAQLDAYAQLFPQAHPAGGQPQQGCQEVGLPQNCQTHSPCWHRQLMTALSSATDHPGCTAPLDVTQVAEGKRVQSC